MRMFPGKLGDFDDDGGDVSPATTTTTGGNVSADDLDSFLAAIWNDQNLDDFSTLNELLSWPPAPAVPAKATSLPLTAAPTMNSAIADILPNILYLVQDQSGVKFVQQRLSMCVTLEEFYMVLRSLSEGGILERLCYDVYGNHIVQKLLEMGGTNGIVAGGAGGRRIYEMAIKGSCVEMSLHPYGCRVIQKCLECLSLQERLAICDELSSSIVRLIEDQNGNHVIQKCVDKLPPIQCHQIIEACLAGDVHRISLHPYGCRVMQRILEHCPHSIAATLLNELVTGLPPLIKDQFGNYVVQHILRYGRYRDKQAVVQIIVKDITAFSCHKYASNVVERCLEKYVPNELRSAVIIAAFGGTPSFGAQAPAVPHDRPNAKPPILSMMRDPFANYVVQRILSLDDLIDLNDPLRRDVVQKLQKHLPALRKFTYGRHIVEGIEKLKKRQQVDVRQ